MDRRSLLTTALIIPTLKPSLVLADISLAGEPSIESIDPSGRPDLGYAQDAGSSSRSFLDTVFEVMTDVYVGLAGALAGYMLGGLPGAIVGSYLAPEIYGSPDTYRTYYSPLAVVERNLEKNLRDWQRQLDMQRGLQDIGFDPDSKLEQAFRNSRGESIPISADARAAMVKIITNAALTTSDKAALGVMMLCSRTDRVDELVKWIAQSSANYLFECCDVFDWQALRAQREKAANQILGSARDAQRTKCNRGTKMAKAARKATLYARKSLIYTDTNLPGGVRGTERAYQIQALDRLVAKKALTYLQQRASGRFARSLGSNAAIRAWSVDLARQNTSLGDFVYAQMLAAIPNAAS